MEDFEYASGQQQHPRSLLLNLLWPFISRKSSGNHRSKCGAVLCGWRRKLGEAIEHKWTQYILIALLVIDIIIVGIEIGLEETMHKSSSEFLHIFEDMLHWISVGILCIFALETILLIIAFDIHFFLHPFYVIDGLVIGVSLLFELYLKDNVGGIIVIFRLWRVLRIIHALVVAEEEAHQRTKQRLQETEAQVQHLQDQLARMKQSKARWKRLCKQSQAVNNGKHPSSPGQSSLPQHV